MNKNPHTYSKKELWKGIHKAQREVSDKDIRESGVGEHNIDLTGSNKAAGNRERQVAAGTGRKNLEDTSHPPGVRHTEGFTDLSVEAESSMKQKRKHNAG